MRHEWTCECRPKCASLSECHDPQIVKRHCAVCGEDCEGKHCSTECEGIDRRIDAADFALDLACDGEV